MARPAAAAVMSILAFGRGRRASPPTEDRRSTRRASWTARACIGVLLAVAALSAGAGLVTSWDPNAVEPAKRLIRPLSDPRHWLGTDNLGRDMWTRLAFGARTSIIVSLLSTCGALLVGVAAGVVGGLARGRTDDIVSWTVNVQLSVPAIVLAISISAVLGTGLANVVLAIGIALWPQFARVARGATIKVRQMPYVEAGVAVGASGVRLASRYVLPNILREVVTLATLEFGHAVVSEAALAFLGFGVEPQRPSWGSMIADGRPYLNAGAWITVFPAITLSAVTIAVSYLGDELEAR